jgi:hypothetical protein
MNIKNEMEALVRAAVRSFREKGPATPNACWCPLCEMDIVALALNLLPPFYCRQETFGYAAGIATAGKIREAVQSAIQRVGLRPKHRPGVPSARDGEVGLVNYTFEIGCEIVGPAVSKSRDACGCPQCRIDALAYALNRYPPKYGVTRGGRRSLHPTYLTFMRHELGMLITQASRVVTTNPNH